MGIGNKAKYHKNKAKKKVANLKPWKVYKSNYRTNYKTNHKTNHTVTRSKKSCSGIWPFRRCSTKRTQVPNVEVNKKFKALNAKHKKLNAKNKALNKKNAARTLKGKTKYLADKKNYTTRWNTWKKQATTAQKKQNNTWEKFKKFYINWKAQSNINASKAWKKMSKAEKKQYGNKLGKFQSTTFSWTKKWQQADKATKSSWKGKQSEFFKFRGSLKDQKEAPWKKAWTKAGGKKGTYGGVLGVKEGTGKKSWASYRDMEYAKEKAVKGYVKNWKKVSSKHKKCYGTKDLYTDKRLADRIQAERDWNKLSTKERQGLLLGGKSSTWKKKFIDKQEETKQKSFTDSSYDLTKYRVTKHGALKDKKTNKEVQSWTDRALSGLASKLEGVEPGDKLSKAQRTAQYASLALKNYKTPGIVTTGSLSVSDKESLASMKKWDTKREYFAAQGEKGQVRQGLKQDSRDKLVTYTTKQRVAAFRKNRKEELKDRGIALKDIKSKYTKSKDKQSQYQKEIRKAQKEYRSNVKEYREDTWSKIASGGYKYQKKGNPFITQSV